MMVIVTETSCENLKVFKLVSDQEDIFLSYVQGKDGEYPDIHVFVSSRNKSKLLYTRRGERLLVMLTGMFERIFKNKSVLGKCMMPLPNCGDESDTLMQMEILELPKILIFALKRFVFVGEENRWKKNNAHVQFYPMRELDISRFAIGQPQKTYSLYAVSNHSGRLASGHYTACCRNPRNQKWYTFNDSNVNLASESKIETPDAYVLYYTSIPPVQEEKQRMSE